MRGLAAIAYALRTSLTRSFLGEPVMVDFAGALLNALIALAHGTAVTPPICG